MSRLATFLASLCIVGGLTACCCPCGFNPWQPVVFNPPPIVFNPPNQDMARFPDKREEMPINLPDPPSILDIKVEPPGIHEKDAHFAFLDLSTKGNIGRLQGAVFADNHLGELPLGVQTLADVPFRVQDRYLLLKDVKHIVNIGVGSKIRRLHVCQAAHNYGRADKPIAYYVLRYTDNTKALLPVSYGRDIVNWWLSDRDPLPESKVAWRGGNPAAKAQGYQVLLYLSTYDNPHPEKAVHTIDYVFGDGGGAQPFCVAMTVEKE